MAKVRTQFLCNHCGSVHVKWMGKCPDCGTWDSLQEFKEPAADARKDRIGASGRVGGRATAAGSVFEGAKAIPVGQIDADDAPRTPTGIGEFDRVLGGGLVPGSATLVGGEPGIGKSTLLLQVAHALAGGRAAGDQPIAAKRRPAADPLKVLYVTSEESAQQTKLRAERLDATGGGSPDGLLVLAETNLERIVHQIDQTAADVVVIDSIQMIYKPDLPAAPGSVTQLRDCCMDLVYLAKARGVSVIFVGHVTKAGTLAGPKIIEHIVDTVIYFEGDRFHAHRVVRCAKNRFGSSTTRSACSR